MVRRLFEVNMRGYSESDLRELRQAARPLMEFLERRHNPHVRAIVDSHSVEVIEGIANEVRDGFTFVETNPCESRGEC